MIRMPVKKWWPKERGPNEPDMTILLMGEARVLLTTWEVTKNKEAVDRMLARTDKLYGKGAEERIRGYMRWIAKHERLA